MQVERSLIETSDREVVRHGSRVALSDHGHLDSVSVKIAVKAAVLLGPLMLVTGSASSALAFAAVAGLIWLTRRRSNAIRGRSRRRPPTGPENDHW